MRGLTALMVLATIVAACAPTAATPQPGIVAVAYRLDSAALAAYIGPPGSGVFRLNPGSYLVELTDASGRVRSLGRITAGAKSIDLSAPEGEVDRQKSDDIRVLARFLLGTDTVRLQTMRLLSGGYQKPLFDRTVRDDAAGEVALAALSRSVTDLRDPALAALGRAELRAQADRVVAAAQGAPTPGLLDGVKEKLTGFVSALTRPGDKARQRIRDLGAKVRTPDQKDLFDAVPERLRGEARDWPSFTARLDQISWYEMAQLESSLRNAAAYGSLAQEAGATTGQVMFEEGANLVTKGAELNVAAIKATLIGAFPDIDIGFGYAAKADEYAEYVQKLYRDPLGTLEGQARETLKEKLKERIKKDIQACCPNVSPDRIAETVAEKVVDAIPQLAATPSPSPAPVGAKPPEKTVTVTITPGSSVLTGGTPIDAGLDLTPYVGGVIEFSISGTMTQTDAQRRVFTRYPNGTQCSATACSAGPENGGNSPMAKYRSSTNTDVLVTEDRVPGYKPRWTASVWFPVPPTAPFSSAVSAPSGPSKGGPFEIPAGAKSLGLGTPIYILQNTTNDVFTGGFVVTITVRPR